jgi:hypothetical protein
MGFGPSFFGPRLLSVGSLGVLHCGDRCEQLVFPLRKRRKRCQGKDAGKDAEKTEKMPGIKCLILAAF